MPKATKEKRRVTVFTDGACIHNPGPGGWGVLLRYQDRERELSGAEQETTNNRMELMAVIQGLEALKTSCKVHLVTDSRYVKDGIEQWLSDWKHNQWRTRNRKPVKNQDLWQRLDKALQRHEVDCQWVRGHSGHTENERVDSLSRLAIQQLYAKP